MQPLMAKIREVNVGITADVEEKLKVVEGSRSALKCIHS